MSQVSFLGLMDDQVTPDEFSETWPKSGLMLGGIVYPRVRRALHIHDSAGGSSGWPTPRVSDTEGGAINNVEFENGSFSRKNADGTRWGVKLRDAVESRLWPTPTAIERSGLNPNAGKGEGLSKVVKEWPTPRAIYGEHSGMTDPRHLTGAVIKWPTPTGRDHKDGTADASRNTPENGYLGRTIHRGQNQPKAALNPDWVEWLMSVPSGWTRLEPVDPSAYSTWFEDMSAGRWWLTERDIPRVAVGMKKRIDRLKALGNGIVPAALARFLTYDD
jgi:hypothetical protein